MTSNFLIYGATGKTGRLTAELALQRSHRPLLGGRSAAKLSRLGKELGLPIRAFVAEDTERARRHLADVDILVNMAGPFSKTAEALALAALSSDTHYLDIAGELAVYQALQALNDSAVACGKMIMPGVGFVVAPSDCLAAHLLERQPDAKYLRIGVSRPGSISTGSAETMVELINEDVLIREAGVLQGIPVGGLVREFDFGCGPRLCTAVSLPDVLTAYQTTRIPNIETYVEATLLERSVYQAGAVLGSALKSAPVQSLLKLQAQALAPAGGDRSASGRILVAEAEDPWRRIVRSRLYTPESYLFTAHTALAIVARILDGNHSPGFETPGRLYGSSLLSELDGTRLEDLPRSVA